MKTLSSILAALLCSASPMLAQEAPKAPTLMSQPAKIDLKLGKESIASLRQAYEKGQYDAFLDEMDTSYKTAVEKKQLAGLAAFRSGAVKPDEKWMEPFKKLQLDKKNELLASIAGEGDSVIVAKVLSTTTELSTPAEEEAIQRLAAFRHLAPGTGKNSDENRLIDLDLEYEYKAIHLDAPMTQGTMLADRREKQTVLQMEKMDRQLAAAQSFEDKSLKEAVLLASQTRDARLAKSWDLADLNDLAKGKVKPASALEEKIASIFSAYQDKITDLYKESFVSQGEK